MPTNKPEISDEENQALLALLRDEAQNDVEDSESASMSDAAVSAGSEQMSFDFPGYIPTGVAVVPQEFARTSLYVIPSDKRGKRKFLRDVTLQTSNPREIQIIYTGEELGPREETLWLTIVRLYRLKKIKFGDPLRTSVNELLKEMKLSNTGGEKGTRALLIRRLIRMNAASLRVRFFRKISPDSKSTAVLNIGINLLRVDFLEGIIKSPDDLHGKSIDELSFDTKSNAPIEIWLDPRGTRLFEELAWQPFDVRLSLKSDGCMRLLSYICTQSIERLDKGRDGFHEINLNTLKTIFGYNGELRKFKDSMEVWLAELEQRGVVKAGWSVFGHGKSSTASWTRTDQAVPDQPPSLVSGADELDI